MNFDTFSASLTGSEPPAGLAPALAALWAEARGDWDGAHELAQRASDTDGAWVHAYLHRKEGDLSNAGYWYRRAGRPVCTDSLDVEWAAIARELSERADG